MVEYNGKKVIIMCCSSCNLNCEHCYISYEGNRTAEDLLDVVRNLKDKYEIALNGAEVLTNLGYLKAYQELGQKYILSNGLAISRNPKTIDKLLEHGIESISISYHFGIHDQISLIPSEELEEVFKKLKEKDFNFRLMTTITTENYHMIEEMCDKAYELGAKGIYFTNFMLQGNALNIEDRDLVLSDEQINSFFKQLMKCREKYKKEELLIERDAGFGRNKLSTHDNFNCPSICDLVVVTPDNNVYPCIFLAKPGNEIGVYQDGKIYIDEKLLSTVQQYNGSTCFAKEICNEGKVSLVKRI
ncbi:MAG: radical SAM protein [Bacilli bacterium]|nr:radical SAM protein [Bacilli bacterium]